MFIEDELLLMVEAKGISVSELVADVEVTISVALDESDEPVLARGV